jgi:hypothetical protein
MPTVFYDQKEYFDLQRAAEGYASEAHELERQLDSTTAQLVLERKENERLTSLVTDLKQAVEIVSQSNKRLVDSVFSQLTTIREQREANADFAETVNEIRAYAIEEREAHAAAKQRNSGLVNDLMSEIDRVGNLEAMLTYQAEVYADLYREHFAGISPLNSFAYNQSLTVLGGAKVDESIIHSNFDAADVAARTASRGPSTDAGESGVTPVSQSPGVLRDAA